MYVCICHSVTEKDIKKAAKKGAQSLTDIQSLTGCATGCGSCADFAADLLQKYQSKQVPEFLKIFNENQALSI